MFKNKISILGLSSLAILGVGSAYNSSYLHAKNDNCEQIEPFEKSSICTQLIKRYKEVNGIPGIVVAVSKDGETIYSRGFGYSDVENSIKARPYTLMRIASISKPITSTVAGILIENKRLDLDKSINEYLDYLPVFKWNDKEVKITCRQLLSHTSGIRHYEKLEETEPDEKKKKNEKNEKLAEFLSNKEYKTTKDALSIFIKDKLSFEPGKSSLYTTYGYTLLSAVLEKCNGEKTIKDTLIELFNALKMNDTYVDLNTPIISNRSKYYKRNSSAQLVNVPEVDSSYKYAGGGILSTTGDLIKFGNYMLDLYQSNLRHGEKLLIRPETIKSLIWSAHSEIPIRNNEDKFIEINSIKTSYGLGWFLDIDKHSNQLEYAYHTGGAVGASSCLLISPNRTKNGGVVVSVLCNTQDVKKIVQFTKSVSQIFTTEYE